MAVRDKETEALRVSIYRRMPPEEKVSVAARLYAQGVELVRASIAAEAPDITPEELRARVLRRVLPMASIPQRGPLVEEGRPMDQPTVLFRVLDALDALAIPYMVVGSFASNYWGRPRMTHDADLLIEMAPSAAAALAERLEGEFYLSAQALREAAERHGHANLIHLQEAFKVDLWVRQPQSYDLERFRRRRRVEVLGRSVVVSSAEDTILAKLRWHTLTPSARQVQDALEVYEIQHQHLDQTYLDRWAKQLGINELLGQIRREAALPPEGGER